MTPIYFLLGLVSRLLFSASLFQQLQKPASPRLAWLGFRRTSGATILNFCIAPRAADIDVRGSLGFGLLVSAGAGAGAASKSRRGLLDRYIHGDGVSSRWTPASQGGTRTTATRGLVEAPAASGHRPRRAESDHVSRMSSALAFGRSREPIEDTICYTRLPSLPSPPLPSGPRFGLGSDLRFPTPHLANWPPVPVTPTNIHSTRSLCRPAAAATSCAGTTARAPGHRTSAAQRSQPVGHAPWWSLRHLIIDRSASGSTEHACIYVLRSSV